jgi:hypothetical protein
MSQKQYSIRRLNDNWEENDSTYTFLTDLGQIDSLSSLGFVDKALTKEIPSSSMVYKLKSKNSGKVGYYLKISDVLTRLKPLKPLKFVKRSTKRSAKRSAKRSTKRNVKKSVNKSVKRKSSKRSQ